MDGELVANFCNITGSEVDVAIEYLQKTNMNLQDALDSYYQTNLNIQSRVTISDSDPHDTVPSAPPSSKRPIQSSTSRFPLKSIGRLPCATGDDGSSDEEDEDKYFVGGGIKSGQMVMRPDDGVNGLVDKIFEQAKGKSKNDGNHEPNSYDDESSENMETAEFVIYQNGFLFNDNFSSFSDPESAEILHEIQEGYIPPKLASNLKRKKVNVVVSDHRNEVYTSKPKPFSGIGHSINSRPFPSSSTSRLTDTPASIMVDSIPNYSITVDSSLMVGSVAVNLPTGVPPRIIIQFNPAVHTIFDIYQHVASHLHHPVNGIVITTNISSIPLVPDRTKTLDEQGINSCALRCSFSKV